MRTITGASTSITAFVGTTKSGPLNSAISISSFADFHRNFGGLDHGSELSYAVQSFFLNGGSHGYVVRVDAKDANRRPYVDTNQPRRGIYALDGVDVFNLMCIPGVSDSAVIADAAAYCARRDAFLLIDAPKATPPSVMQSLAAGSMLPKSEHAALFWPYTYVADALAGGSRRLAAPSGAMAGVFARIDTAHGVWKAPAGKDAAIAGAEALEFEATGRQIASLNRLAVNCIRTIRANGIVAWGARTMNVADAAGPEDRYVPVRRLANYIKLSLFRGTQWVVFEPNAEPLWAQIRASAGGFMDTLFRQGAFAGTTARDAYFVRCDRQTMTQTDVDGGVVNIVVGFAPLKPAEFVIITVTHIARRTP